MTILNSLAISWQSVCPLTTFDTWTDEGRALARLTSRQKTLGGLLMLASAKHALRKSVCDRNRPLTTKWQRFRVERIMLCTTPTLGRPPLTHNLCQKRLSAFSWAHSLFQPINTLGLTEALELWCGILATVPSASTACNFKVKLSSAFKWAWAEHPLHANKCAGTSHTIAAILADKIA